MLELAPNGVWRKRVPSAGAYDRTTALCPCLLCVSSELYLCLQSIQSHSFTRAETPLLYMASKKARLR